MSAGRLRQEIVSKTDTRRGRTDGAVPLGQGPDIQVSLSKYTARQDCGYRVGASPGWQTHGRLIKDVLFSHTIYNIPDKGVPPKPPPGKGVVPPPLPDKGVVPPPPPDKKQCF